MDFFGRFQRNHAPSRDGRGGGEGNPKEKLMNSINSSMILGWRTWGPKTNDLHGVIAEREGIESMRNWMVY